MPLNTVHLPLDCLNMSTYKVELLEYSVIFVNKNENENGEKRENDEFVNEN